MILFSRDLTTNMSEFYKRKLYALLRSGDLSVQLQGLPESDRLRDWWSAWERDSDSSRLHLSEAIASSSDRVNLRSVDSTNSQLSLRHPISGQHRDISPLLPIITASDLGAIASWDDAEKVFWWIWRFYPELLSKQDQNGLLYPAHTIIPDCPQHSYRATVSALVGAMFPDGSSESSPEHPYLLLFTFSPVQEFIKASRKFLDFWAGSYLLHYLGAKLCWYIALKYGPDAVITPSLWSQEIIDALMLQRKEKVINDLIVRDREKVSDFTADFICLTNGHPVSRFQNQESTSLSTAGFPNVITALVPKSHVKDLGEELAKMLKAEWQKIAENVRSHIRGRISDKVATDKDTIWKAIASEFPSSEDPNPYLRELEKWKDGSSWEWSRLWDAQISNTWETYWTAVPLGHPEKPLEISLKSNTEKESKNWKDSQQEIAQSRGDKPIPSTAEEETYEQLNVGTWWGSLQARLGQSIQAVKNTRTWQIPPAPGERSSLSGQFSAVHPNLLYNNKFCEGGGLPASSLRLFWRVMAEVYPGLFNGAEKLNALELTKRMAWQYGGVAASLGIQNPDTSEEDYESWMRFPNLSSIASARFAHDNPQKVRQYWEILRRLIEKEGNFDSEQKKRFPAKTRRPFQVPKTDKSINPEGTKGKDYNGVMFSSKWLAEDMKLQRQQVNILRTLVNNAHQECGLGDGSPADWWAIVLADGDGMGKYVSGSKLKEYEQYIVKEQVSEQSRNAEGWDELLATRKRMGPATHVGLNRALLDFSNRLVPYLTEKRFCGKVVYSGGDDVMALLPLEDLPEYLLSLRAAWCGSEDPKGDFENEGGYWQAKNIADKGLPDRPLFTMGKDATMSVGIVIAYKSVPLPTVLETLWTAEKDRAKKLPGKDGLCFRVIYGGGNVLEALMKGHLLESWWNFISLTTPELDLSPMLYRLAEELPRRATVTECDRLFYQAAGVIWDKSELGQTTDYSRVKDALLNWLGEWENWAWEATEKWEKRQDPSEKPPLGIGADDLGKLLRFSAFWVAKRLQLSYN